MENTNDNRNLTAMIFKALGMAMGVAVIVLNILGTAAPQTSALLLGLGMTSLALVFFQRDRRS